MNHYDPAPVRSAVDLHTHTTASDGALTPRQLLDAARDAGIDVLAITDHDVMHAYDELRDTRDIELVPGIELSARHDRIGVHVVGLNIDRASAALRTALEYQGRAREQRAERIADRLARHGYAGALDGARRHAGGRYLCRPHFAAWLIEIGAVKDAAQAFRKFLGREGGALELWPSLGTAIEWIRGAGGTAVLAHPARYGLTRSRLERLTTTFRSAGGSALEVISGRQSAEVTRAMAALAHRHGLSVSLGSDFHRPGQPWAELGRVAAPPPGCVPVWDTW